MLKRIGHRGSDGPQWSQAQGAGVESEWRRSCLRRFADGASGRYARPKPARSSRRARLLVAGLVLGVLGTVLWTHARGADWHLVAHGISHHTGQRIEARTTLEPMDVCATVGRKTRCNTVMQYVTRDVAVDYNERNWGAGLRAELTPAWSVQGGAYRNSYDRTSVYLLADWTPVRVGAFAAGLFGGLATGYDHGIAAAGVIGRLQARRLSVAVRFVPQASEKQTGSTVALELGWRL